MRMLSRLASIIVLLLVLAGCDTEGTSLYDPDRPVLPDPVVQDVSPTGSALAGIDVLTITGQNFSATLEQNLVYFGSVRGTMLEATPTMLRVVAPNTPGDDVSVRVAVIGAENYSNAVSYDLINAAAPIGGIAQSEEVFGIAPDGAGGAFVSVFREGSSAGIQRLAPDGSRSLYFDTTFPWSGLAFNTDGVLYGVRGARAIFALPEGGSQQVFAVAPNGFTFNAITTDADGNVWVGGDNTGGPGARAIYKIDPAGELTAFPFEARVRDMIVYDGFLWAVGRAASGAAKVWRFPLSGGALGAAEEVVTVFQNETNTAFALAASADGALFIGTDAADPLLVYENGALSPLYPGILTAPATGLAWGEGSGLYLVRGRVVGPGGDVVVLPNLIRVETRRTGAASLTGATLG